MIIITLNIRGGGCRAKRKRIGYLIQKGKVDMCFLQETKFLEFNNKVTGAFWGSKDVELSYCAFAGASGGLRILWRKNLLYHICSF